MTTEKTSFFLQFQLLLDTHQQRSHIKTSHRVMQQYRCYYCANEFQTFLETIDHTRVGNQKKIVKTSVCLFGCLCWGRSGIVFLKTSVFELPGHHLCSPEPGWSVCVISIQKGVNVKSAEKRLVRKRNFLLCIPHRRDLKQYSQNACFCMCSLWPLPLTYFSHHGQYMNQVNYWFICFQQSSFHICPLWPWSFIPDLENQ